MSSRRLTRYCALLVFVYITADFMNPSVPGVFFFDNDAFFVDGVIQVKSNASADRTPTEPKPFAFWADYVDTSSAAKVRAVARPTRPQHLLWKNLKRDDSRSFASSSPPDSAPTRSQS
jgi:hypothetical protein